MSFLDALNRPPEELQAARRQYEGVIQDHTLPQTSSPALLSVLTAKKVPVPTGVRPPLRPTPTTTPATMVKFRSPRMAKANAGGGGPTTANGPLWTGAQGAAPTVNNGLRKRRAPSPPSSSGGKVLRLLSPSGSAVLEERTTHSG